MERNRSIQWCPHPGCERAVRGPVMEPTPLREPQFAPRHSSLHTSENARLQSTDPHSDDHRSAFRLDEGTAGSSDSREHPSGNERMTRSFSTRWVPSPPPVLGDEEDQRLPLAVDCGGGHFFCWGCREAAHAPATCAQWRDWRAVLAQVPACDFPSLIVAG